MSVKVFQVVDPANATSVHYVNLFNPEGEVWHTGNNAFEAWNDAHFANYAIALTQQGATPVFFGELPAEPALNNLWLYPYTVWSQLAAGPDLSPVLGSDTCVGGGTANDDRVSQCLAAVFGGTTVLSDDLKTITFNDPDGNAKVVVVLGNQSGLRTSVTAN